MVRRRFPAAIAGPAFAAARRCVCPRSRGEPTSGTGGDTAAGSASVWRVHRHLALVVLGREPKGGAGGARRARVRRARRVGGLSPHRAHAVAQLKAASRCRVQTGTANDARDGRFARSCTSVLGGGSPVARRAMERSASSACRAQDSAPETVWAQGARRPRPDVPNAEPLRRRRQTCAWRRRARGRCRARSWRGRRHRRSAAQPAAMRATGPKRSSPALPRHSDHAP